jgi:hypothetical protein
MSTAQHTPTPWYVEPCQWDHGESIVITARNIGIICRIEPPNKAEPFTKEIDEANAAFIVRACNAFDALYAVCASLKRRLSELDNEDEPLQGSEAVQALADIWPLLNDALNKASGGLPRSSGTS